MRKLALVSLLALLPGMVFAHPPKSVDLSFDSASQLLTVTVTHLIKETKITDPTKHFVKDIALVVNGKPAVSAVYSYQEFDEGEKVVFRLNLKAGDKVAVTGSCSIAGKKTAELTVPTN